MAVPAFIESYIKLARAGAAPGSSKSLAETLVKRPDLRPQAYTQKNPPGGVTDPNIGAQQKSPPPPSVWGA